jgi:hypothetical protein
VDFEISSVPQSLGVRGARITQPSGRLGDYLTSLDLPAGAAREYSVYVDYDKRGMIEHASLQADVIFQNQLYSRIIFAGGRGQFED